MKTVGVFDGWEQRGETRWARFCNLGVFQCVCEPSPRPPRIGDIIWFETDADRRITVMRIHDASENE